MAGREGNRGKDPRKQAPAPGEVSFEVFSDRGSTPLASTSGSQGFRNESLAAFFMRTDPPHPCPEVELPGGKIGADRLVRVLCGSFGRQRRRETIAMYPANGGRISGVGRDVTAGDLDEGDKPVRRAIFWSDNRSTRQADFLRENYASKIYARSHNCVSSARTLTHLLWIRENEPDKFSRIRRVMFMKDYVRYRLTGSFVTDYIDAMGSQLMDVPAGCWSEEFLRLAGLPLSAMPQILTPTDVVACITENAARETGLSRKTKVICGTTDTVMEVFANGAIRPGQMTLKLATAGRICVITEHNIENPRLINYKHVIPGLWYPGTGTKTCASSYRWYRDVFCADETRLAAGLGKDAYILMDQMAAAVEPGSNDLFFHPYLQGEATPYFDDRLKGSFVGASAFHKKEHFTRALLEGVAYSLRDSLNVLQSGEVSCEEAIVIGGGAKSPLWRQIVADVLGIRLIRTKDSDSSLGSAMLAGVACGMFSSFEDSIEKCVQITGNKTLPSAENAAIYDRGFGIYRQIHDALAPVYHAMSDR